MRRRTFLGGTCAVAVLGLLLAVNAAAQEEEAQPSAADTPTVNTDADAVSPPPAVFVRITDPQDDLEVPLATTAVTVRGETLPGAIVSVDGNLVDVDDGGTFAALVLLDEGANAIDVVASTPDGSVTDTTVLVMRGTE